MQGNVGSIYKQLSKPSCAPSSHAKPPLRSSRGQVRVPPWVIRSLSSPRGTRGQRHKNFRRQSASASVTKWGLRPNTKAGSEQDRCRGLATSQMCVRSKASGTDCPGLRPLRSGRTEGPSRRIQPSRRLGAVKQQAMDPSESVAVLWPPSHPLSFRLR